MVGPNFTVDPTRRPAGDVRILAALGTMPDDVVARARHVAAIMHAQQADKAGRPYLQHPARVAARLAADGQPAETVAVGWLHDVVEDTTLTVQDLQAVFADHPRVAPAVAAITRGAHQPGDDYYRQVMADPIALAVKWADLCDNLDADRMALLPGVVRTRLRAKYAHAIQVLSAA